MDGRLPAPPHRGAPPGAVKCPYCLLDFKDVDQHVVRAHRDRHKAGRSLAPTAFQCPEVPVSPRGVVSPPSSPPYTPVQCKEDDAEPASVFFRREGDLVRHRVDKHGASAHGTGFWMCPVAGCGAIVALPSVAGHHRRRHPGNGTIATGRCYDRPWLMADHVRCPEVRTAARSLSLPLTVPPSLPSFHACMDAVPWRCLASPPTHTVSRRRLWSCLLLVTCPPERTHSGCAPQSGREPSGLCLLPLTLLNS